MLLIPTTARIFAARRRTHLGHVLATFIALVITGCGGSTTTSTSLTPRVSTPAGGGTGRIAYVCRGGAVGAAANICTSALDGSNALQLTRVVSPADAIAPRWSHDGNRIAFQVRPDPSSDATDIYSVLADGSGQMNLTHNPAARNGGAAWSPDNLHIVFHTQRDHAYTELYTMDANGSSVRRLLDGIWAQFPDWSPDGTQIVFMGNTEPSGGEDDWNIYVVRADGNGVHPLTTDVGLDAGPVWSPDGTRILYTGPAEPQRPVGHFECFVMAADGSGKTQLTHTQNGSATCGDWSPDGSRVLFTRTTTNGNQVWIMNADGSGQTRLADPPANIGGLVWQP